jgi:hypothetical protein
MLPRWHIFWGAIFTVLFWIISPKISWLNLTLIFLASFLIDFDHYAASAIKTRKIGLFHSFKYHKKLAEIEEKENRMGVRRKGDFHLFHTVEFHALVGLLGLIWIGFFYLFIGMVFHSLLDIIQLIYDDRMYRREFFLVSYLARKI